MVARLEHVRLINSSARRYRSSVCELSIELDLFGNCLLYAAWQAAASGPSFRKLVAVFQNEQDARSEYVRQLLRKTRLGFSEATPSVVEVAGPNTLQGASRETGDARQRGWNLFCFARGSAATAGLDDDRVVTLIPLSRRSLLAIEIGDLLTDGKALIRVAQTLYNAGIRTVGQLAELRPATLRRLANDDAALVETIRCKLQKLQLDLGAARQPPAGRMPSASQILDRKPCSVPNVVYLAYGEHRRPQSRRTAW